MSRTIKGILLFLNVGTLAKSSFQRV